MKKTVIIKMDKVLYESMRSAVEADRTGGSISQFVRTAISEKIYRDGKESIE